MVAALGVEVGPCRAMSVMSTYSPAAPPPTSSFNTSFNAPPASPRARTSGTARTLSWTSSREVTRTLSAARSSASSQSTTASDVKLALDRQVRAHMRARAVSR